MSRREEAELLLSEERLRAETAAVPAGSVTARKQVETRREAVTVDVGTEHADVQREKPLAEDDGEVHVLEDGSVSIPVFEEQVVVTKRLVVRERVVLRKHTVVEEHRVSADLRREHLVVEPDPAVAGRVTGE